MVPSHQYDHICGGIRTFLYQSHLRNHHNMSLSMTAMTEEDARSDGGGKGAAGEGCSDTRRTNGDDLGGEGDLGTSDSTQYWGRGGRRGTGREGRRGKESEGVGGGDEDWLQLGIGRSTSRSTTSGVDTSTGERRERVFELNLFSDSPSGTRLSRQVTPVDPTAVGCRPALTSPVTIFQTPYRQQPWEMSTLGLRNPGSTSSDPIIPYGSGWARPAYQTGYMPTIGGGRNYEELRVVVNPPSRPATGLWFVLQASQNQVKEPFLHQIPKSYLRIKDGMMTIRLLMKYLVSKLGLQNESEVEVTCRGQVLQPNLTVQYVRDNIWCTRNTVVVMSPESAVSHVMTLQYTRSSTTSSTTTTRRMSSFDV